MNKHIAPVKGMNDILSEEMDFFNYVIQVASKQINQSGYEEISVPLMEKTNLFARSIGEASDIVSKEMYSFTDRNKESLTLRPEATASVVRAGLTHSLFYKAQKRLWTQGPMFRYEKPQQARYRQFHQISVEAFGFDSMCIDAELILLSKRIWNALGITSPRLEINSIGSFESRKRYAEVLKDYFYPYKSEFDEDDLRRLDKNPLRILDSKNEKIIKIKESAPKISDFLDKESALDFELLCNLLEDLQVDYTINNGLVRGLDYYNKTVFEWATDKLGAQSAICSGGRYDGLVKQLGGEHTSACGWALGIERVVALLKVEEVQIPSRKPDVYLIPLGDKATVEMTKIIEKVKEALNNTIIWADYFDGSLKSKLKKADKSGAQLALILGDEELDKGELQIKELRNRGTPYNVSFDRVNEAIELALKK
jgi:histidyl-tRNA synthetase